MAIAVGKSWQLANRGDGRGDMLPDIATFYVSPTGDDNDDGRSRASAWRTVGKVNSVTLEAGQSVGFERDGVYDDEPLQITDSGVSGSEIIIKAVGVGAAPVLRAFRTTGNRVEVENINFDNALLSTGGSDFQDRICEIWARNVKLRDCEIQNGQADGVDIRNGADRVTIERCHIHHLLRGNFGEASDAHCVAIRGDGVAMTVNIIDCDFHEMSGDCLQADPSRIANSQITVNISGNTRFWTQPLKYLPPGLTSDWLVGDSPGEDGIDIKSDSTLGSVVNINISGNFQSFGFRDEGNLPRQGDPYTNRTPFNFKESLVAVVEQATLYNCTLAFRCREVSPRGTPDVTMKNVVMYNCDREAVWNSDCVVRTYNCTFGNAIPLIYRDSGTQSGSEFRNNACLNGVPPEWTDPTNLESTLSDHIDVPGGDYRIAPGSDLIGAGADLSGVGVTDDRDGNPRTPPYDVGAYAYLGS